MNCPKCGKELLIGSEVCPDCDLTQKKEVKKRRKLTRFGKLFIISLCAVAAAICAISAVSAAKRASVHGAVNGNFANGSCAAETSSNYYYSDGEALYYNNKRFSAEERIDKGSKLYNVIYTNDCAFYTKDGTLYQFNPKTRKIKSLYIFDSEYTVAGYSNKEIYFSSDSGVYKYLISGGSFEKLISTPGILYKNKIYTVEGTALCSYNRKTLARKEIAQLPQHTILSFVQKGRVFCCSKSDMSLISVPISGGEIRSEMTANGLKNVSDITRLNTYSGSFFISGEKKLMKYVPSSGECTPFENCGYVQSTASLKSALYLVSPGENAFFCDENGNIKFTVGKKQGE